ncbi:MAG: hypothetical protein QNJ40_26915 [Xanthomonadales bacterium]|nr:hypothetical protein [Xanthomonadales bacterium]
MNPDSLRRLQAMGIQPWQLRPPPESRPVAAASAAVTPQPVAPPPEPPRSTDPGRRPAARRRPDSRLVPLQVPEKALANLVVHWGDDFQLSPSHPAGELLLNIARALHADVAQLGFFRSGDAQPNVAGLGNPVFWFGDRSPAPDGAYALPSLRSMLEDPSSKRRAWAVLKPWAARLG